MFKLYRPTGSNIFACRKCHDLTYRCVQQHEKRLDWLVKAPDWVLMDLMDHLRMGILLHLAVLTHASFQGGSRPFSSIGIASFCLRSTDEIAL